MKLEEFLPAFDVYCLGKVLWSMLTGVPDTSLPTRFADDATATIRETIRGMAEVEAIVDKCVVLDAAHCLPDTNALLAEIESTIQELTAPAPALPLQMAAHALSRPGGISLFSAEAPRKAGVPESSQPVKWTIYHPIAREIAGVTGDRTPVEPTDDVWKAFEERSAWRGRHLLNTWRDYSDRASIIECEFSQWISLADARFLQLSIQVDESIGSVLYLRFGKEPYYLRYDPSVNEPVRHPEEPHEWAIPETALRGMDELQTITRDIQVDLQQTWQTDTNAKIKSITGFRLRGKFRLLFLKIV